MYRLGGMILRLGAAAGGAPASVVLCVGVALVWWVAAGGGGLPRHVPAVHPPLPALRPPADGSSHGGEDAAALNLLDRALALAPSGEIDLALEVDLLDALFFSGQTRDAYMAAGLVAERAAAAGDRVAELSALIEEGVFRLLVEPEGAAEQLA